MMLVRDRSLQKYTAACVDLALGMLAEIKHPILELPVRRSVVTLEESIEEPLLRATIQLEAEHHLLVLLVIGSVAQSGFVRGEVFLSTFGSEMAQKVSFYRGLHDHYHFGAVETVAN